MKEPSLKRLKELAYECYLKRRGDKPLLDLCNEIRSEGCPSEFCPDGKIPKKWSMAVAELERDLHRVEKWNEAMQKT